MTRKQIFILILAVSAAIFIIVISPGFGRAYPDCDNGPAKAALAALYDNRRLLRAVDVIILRQDNDSLNQRSCMARVSWSDGSQSDVPYAFNRGGKNNRLLSMWIDYNGGMRGPSY